MFSCTSSMPCNLPVRCGFGTVSSWCVSCLSMALFFLECLWSAACKQNNGTSRSCASRFARSTMLRAMFPQYIPMTWPCLNKSVVSSFLQFSILRVRSWAKWSSDKGAAGVHVRMAVVISGRWASRNRFDFFKWITVSMVINAAWATWCSVWLHDTSKQYDMFARDSHFQWGLWPLSATLLTPRWSCSSTFSRARSKCRCSVRCWWSRRRTGWSSWSSWSGLISAGISAHLPVPVRCWRLRISEVVAKEELCPAFLGALGGPAKIQHSCPAIDLFAVILDVIRKKFSIECWANPAIHVSGILLTTLLANNGLLAVTNADQDHGVAVGVLIALLGFDVLSRLCWWDNIESDSV